MYYNGNVSRQEIQEAVWLGQTKGVFAHGSPGSGKSFVLEAQELYAMTQGLRVMSTSLMAVRSNALGGYHIHKLFTLEVNKNTNVFRLAELAMDKLDRKSKIIFHILYGLLNNFILFGTEVS